MKRSDDNGDADVDSTINIKISDLEGEKSSLIKYFDWELYVNDVTKLFSLKSFLDLTIKII